MSRPGSAERRLLVMAKAPWPGLAKTRLARSAGLGDAAVARLSEAMLRDTLLAARALEGVARTACYDPAEARAFFAALDPGADLEPQAAGDLGARLVAATRAAFARGAREVAVVGSDAPHAGGARIAAAFDRLAEADVVLGPTPDGGYWIVALRAPADDLFADISWSTPQVLRETCARAEAHGLRVALADEVEDVDDAQSLERLARSVGPECPHTAAALAALGLARLTP